MTDDDIFDPARVAARLAEVVVPPPADPRADPESPEWVAVAWTMATNGMDPVFDGTYCGRAKVGRVVDVVPNAGGAA